jgi:hypothetical protein
MIDDIIVIDNVINKTYQTELENSLLKEMGPAWFLLDDVAYPGAAVHHQQPGLVHPLFEENQGILSPLYHLAIPMVFEAVSRIQFDLHSIARGRAFLQFPTPVVHTNHAHVDFNDPHLVCLYYVNDSDGETVLYDQTTNDIANLPGMDTSLLSVKTKVSPAKGRVVLFNGNRYHSSSTPSKNKRCVINFDLLGNTI